MSTVLKAIADIINFIMLCPCLVIDLKNSPKLMKNNLPISIANMWNYPGKSFPAFQDKTRHDKY